MGWNDQYWERKNDRARIAMEHHMRMMSRFNDKIKTSVRNTEIWDDTSVDKDIVLGFGSPRIDVVNKDTVSALFDIDEGRTVVLNFASYKNPGGGFLKGSSAQEESLCHDSVLYEILSDPDLSSYYEFNKTRLNSSLYTNRALYSPDVLFERNGVAVFADVLTCAAPNRYAFLNYAHGVSESLNMAALDSRIKFVCDVIKRHDVDTAILGAFGCGVFAQDPKVVALLFKKEFARTDINTVYAVIDKGGHTKEGAYNLFCEVFEK